MGPILRVVKLNFEYLAVDVAVLGAAGDAVVAALVGESSGKSAGVPGRMGLGGANML